MNNTVEIADRLAQLKYKVAVIGSVIKDREADRNEKEGAGFLCYEIQSAIDEVIALVEEPEAKS